MMKKFFFLLLFVLIVSEYSALAQEDDEHEHHHDYEIGFTAGWVIIIQEQESVPGFHLHVLKSFGTHNSFSTGPGLEFIPDEHAHMAVVWSLGFRPVHPWYLGVAPGIEFPLSSHEEEAGPGFAMHFETVYEFEFNWLHIGPMIEYGIGKEHSHFTVAVHAGINF